MTAGNIADECPNLKGSAAIETFTFEPPDELVEKMTAQVKSLWTELTVLPVKNPALGEAANVIDPNIGIGIERTKCCIQGFRVLVIGSWRANEPAQKRLI